MKAILEFDAPESCGECPLVALISNDTKICVYTQRKIRLAYMGFRAPFCPLKIVEVNDTGGKRIKIKNGDKIVYRKEMSNEEIIDAVTEEMKDTFGASLEDNDDRN